MRSRLSRLMAGGATAGALALLLAGSASAQEQKFSARLQSFTSSMRIRLLSCTRAMTPAL